MTLLVKYAVETQMLGTWENCWTEILEDGTERPEYFDSITEAQAAIDQHLADVAFAVRCGDMAEEYDPDDYRVVVIDAETGERLGVI